MSLWTFFTLENGLTTVSIVTSAMAAMRWYQASIVMLPSPAILKEEPVNPTTGRSPISMGNEAENTRALNDAQREILLAAGASAGLNAAGARWAAATAIMLAGSMAAKLFGW